MENIAFFGLGNMGAPMSANLVRAGYRVTAFDPSDAALWRAVDKGCVRAESALQAVQGASAVISMLPGGDAVKSLYLGQDGLLRALAGNTLVIDCSTIAAEDARQLITAAGELGLRAIDAPVSGGTAAAAAGTLSFMCGGDKEAVDAARPYLQAMGAKLFHAGPAGAGQVAKICNNMLLAIHMIGTAEALQLGVDNGLDPVVLSEIMKASSGGNWSLEKYNPYPGVMEKVPAANGYAGGFSVALMLKDLGLAMDTAAASASSTPLGALAKNLYQLHGSCEENRRLDFSSIQNLFRRPAGG
ncbi:3-hydroxyisobutyrate dehydrogenase [Microbulbifer thermotolerans]|uniref:3-hydroxyisobutyrate dehydrogenase n=1 Tax=Microbulbifer thermotolerans TaxID=252514 RepID=UPI00224AB96A|nr:3-hydroxyisobutyrate dehydrogenase [Microbulbifer thermotolerans]MCX2784123.1 3-hydroxyisobutyrate dehydrogenase [Microbulbifer thermotolerans]MCX2841641.1 3-hydroxyisobutyrate dehydrogenase [Microbulbifer thermotolerans]